MATRVFNFASSSLLVENLKNFFPEMGTSETEVKQAMTKVLKTYLKEFGLNLKKLRTKKGINQVPFAKQLGVTQTTYSSWETGSHVPRLSKILLISELLGIDVGELFLMPYASSIQYSLPVFVKDDFIEIKLQNFFKDNIQHHQIRVVDNFFKKYQFVFRNTDDEMIEQGYGIPKNSNVYCTYDHCFNNGLLGCIQKVDEDRE